MFGYLPGRSLEDAAKRELGQLNDTRTGTTNYNWQDHVGGFFGNYSQEDVEKRAEEIANETLKQKFDTRYASKNIKDRLGELTGNYKGVKGLSIADITAAQESDDQRANQLEAYKQTKGANVGLLAPTISSSGIQGATTRLVNDELTRLEVKQDDKEIRAETKADKLLAMQLGISNQQNALQNKRLDLSDLRDQRQQEYNNRVLDQRDAQAMRNARDKQFAMILAGLNNVGQIFA